MRSETAKAVTRSQRPSGGLLHAPLSNALFYGWQQVRSGAKIRSTFFGRVNASSREGLGNPPFFWQFVKSGLDTPSCLEMVELLEAPAFSTRSPPSMAAFPAAFFIACGRPNQERSSLLLLPVLLLLTGEHLEEVGGVKNEGRDLWGVGTPGVFFFTGGRCFLGGSVQAKKLPNSPTTHLPLRREDESQMRLTLTTKSGVFP